MKRIEEINLASRVQFVPFILSRSKEQAVIGRLDGTDYLEFDAIGGDIISRLDAGKTIAEVQCEVEHSIATTVDVVSFVDELEDLGYVMLLHPEEAHSGSARVFPRPRSHVHFLYWWGFVTLSLLACFSTLVSFSLHPLLWPPISALVLPEAPLFSTIVVLFLNDFTSNVFHEGAHMLTGYLYGLSPRIRFSRRGIWFVIETDLTGIWQLDRAWRWRPLLAGLMSDITLVAIALLMLQYVTPQSFPYNVAQIAILLILIKMLWQCQWYLRTDLYFLWLAMSNVRHIRQAAWQLFLRKKGGEDQQLVTDTNKVAVMFYLFSLPLAVGATGVLCLWFIFPVVLAGLHALLSIIKR